MKSSHPRSRHNVWRICAAAFLCAATSASAQTVHKQIDMDGHITFTDQAETTPLARKTKGPGLDVASALARNAPMTSMHAATVDYNEATRRLVRARQSRNEGRAFRLEEGADSAGIKTMNGRIQRGQQRLDSEVVAAQRRSNQTSLVRSDLLRIDGRTDGLQVAKQ